MTLPNYPNLVCHGRVNIRYSSLVKSKKRQQNQLEISSPRIPFSRISFKSQTFSTVCPLSHLITHGTDSKPDALQLDLNKTFDRLDLSALKFILQPQNDFNSATSSDVKNDKTQENCFSSTKIFQVLKT